MNAEKNTSFELQKRTIQGYRRKKDRIIYQNNKLNASATNQNLYTNIATKKPPISNKNFKYEQDDTSRKEAQVNSTKNDPALFNESRNQLNISNKFKDDNKKIGFVTSFLMIFLAISFDAVQALFNLIPFIGNMLSVILIDTFAWISFYVWFKILGVDFSKPSRMGTMIGSGLIEMIPIVNALPTWTLAVFIIIATTKVKGVVLK